METAGQQTKAGHSDEDRRRLALRHTARVNVLRWVLPLVAGITLLSLMLYPVVFDETLLTKVAKDIPNLVIDNLHFSGVDDQRQPYNLAASKATRASVVESVYDLEKPEGDMALNSGAWVALKAERGRFDQSARRLWLGGGIRMFHDAGYEFITTDALVDMEAFMAWGNSPVFIQGDFGHVDGQGFRMVDKGKTLIVKGPARAMLHLRMDPTSDTRKNQPR